MKLPIVGVVTNNRVLDEGYHLTGTGIYELEALRHISKVIPILIPAVRGVVSAEEALDLCDGFYLPGGRANVDPEHYGQKMTERHGEINPCRDRLSLPLVRAAVEVGKPVFGVCRGHQELAVAFGSSLFAEVRDEPGRMNHRMPPDGTIDEKFAIRHDIAITKGGVLEEILGAERVAVNTLHGQAVNQIGERVAVEAIADDETIEAISIKGAKAMALGVQWHPEYAAAERDVSRKLFEAFGAALRGEKAVLPKSA